MNEFLAQEFIKGFLDESEELLAGIHKHLLAIERNLGSPAPSFDEQAVVTELLRAFHTLKGLVGMAELEPGADLAHAIESVLYRAMREHARLPSPTIETLFAATRALEAVVATLADPTRPLPDLTAVERRLAALDPGRPSPSRTLSSPASLTGAEREALSTNVPPGLLDALTEDDLKALRRVREEGAAVHFARFRPAPLLIERGINVNVARARIEEGGKILKGVPLICDGQIEFGFLVALPQGEDLEMEGLDVISLEAATAVEQPDEAASSQDWQAEFRRGPSDTVRVEIDRLDEIMRLVGDLVVSRARLQAAIEQVETEGVPRPALVEASQKLERQLRGLRDAVMRARMVPLAQVFGRMPLAVRDLARQYGREVELIIEGGETQVDKLLVERLLEPLLHLVRNAIAHGIEATAARRALGKPIPGTLTMRGRAEGDSIVITVADDGAGIDLAHIAAKARELGWLRPGDELGPAELLDIITRPGFSTRAEADHGAGRGMGMDVVARAVRSVAGRLDLVTAAGTGTTFSIRLPLTLAIIDAFIVQVDHEQYAVPRSAIDYVVEVEQVVRAPGGELMAWRGGALPLVRLAPLFGLPPSDGGGVGLVHGVEGRARALVVDRVLGLREVVVTAVSDPLLAQVGIAGATELGDGRVALIVDVPAVVRRGMEARN